MGLVIAVYTKEAFKEYILPAVNNTDYTIVLNRNYFNLRSDIRLDFEVINESWRIKPGKVYQIYLDKSEVREKTDLGGDEMFRILTYDKKQIYLMVRENRESFRPYKKYDISRMVRITIGDSEGSLIKFNYRRLISGEHAEIIRKGRGYAISSKGQNGLYVNAKYVTGTEPLHFGDYINIYSLHMVFLGEILAVDTENENVRVNEKFLVPYAGKTKENEETGGAEESESESESAKKLFHRSPRVIEKIEDDVVEIEEPPKEMKSQKKPLLMTIGPSFTMAIPMLLGALLMIASSRASGGTTGLFMYSGLIMAVSSAMIGVVWGTVNIRYQKKTEAENETHRYEAYSDYLVKKTEEIRKKYAHNQTALNRMYPETDVCMSYTENTAVLWNRNFTHADFLCCRMGQGDLDFQVTIQVPKEKFRLDKDELAEKPEFIENNYRTLTNVPILLDLLEHKLVGIVGGERKKGALEAAKIIAAQLAACNCYTDVKMIFVYDEDNSDDAGQWEFARWLPHAWSGDKKIRYIASNKLEAGEIFYEITRIFRQRMEDETGASSEKRMIPKPYFVMFLSDPSLIEDELIARYVFDSSPEIGLSTVMLVSNSEMLPNACEYIVENDSFFQGIYNVSAQKEDRIKVHFDTVDAGKLDTFSRRLSDIEVQEMETGGEIPGSLTFFDMYGISRPEELKAEERWLKNRSYDNIRGLIGQKSGGAPCYMDVHEKYHGPHGLVAGTTGSGKSETLQTYMLSLAINYSPDDIGYFIIDYKGGGMANLFDGLPHMIGQISNLSGNQVYRAMVSIKSEIRRRQGIFAENDVNNINSYTKLYKNRETSVPIPHLFIIIDEFAELKREEPEFMKELISVAQVGRSLGVHLILATQKPSGTVDDNIWSNSRFRLCLRVQDRQDSNDMLHKPDAAYITQAGRCYLQVGNDEVYELFQSGWSGAPYDENTEKRKTEIARLLSVNGRTEIAGGMRSARRTPAKGKEKTQLDAVKEYLRKTVEENHYGKNHQLWMPVLPGHICLSELKEYQADRFTEEAGWKTPAGPWSLEIPVGMVDDPENQAQFPLRLSFSEGGHHAIIGAVVSGKSTMMRTILYGLVTKYSPDYLNIYGLDFSSRMMDAFNGLAHFGGVMYEGDDERIARFFNMIMRILDERKKLFRGGNYSQYVQVHGVKVPAIIIAIDNFAAFKEKTEDAYEKKIIQLSKEGVGHGIFLLLSAGGFGMNEIPNRIAENMKTVLCLELPDKFAYGDVLHMTQIRVMPETGIKGRGLAVVGSRVLEYQAALALEAEDDYQRKERISQECELMNAAWTGRCAQPVPEIPQKPVWELFAEHDDVKKALETDSLLPVGYNSANAEIYSVDLSRIYCYLITGAAKTGKKNFMKVMLEAARLKHSQICLIDGGGLMARYSGQEGLDYVGDADALFEYFQNTLTPEFKRRNLVKQRILEEGGDEEELYAYTRKEQPVFLFITDMRWFIDSLYAAENIARGMKGFMETLTLKGRYHNIYFAGILNLEDKNAVQGYQTFVNFISYKTGVHFGGNVVKNEMMSFDYIPYGEKMKTEKPGIGRLPEIDGEIPVEKLIVPLVGKGKKEQ